ncbi:uncharacterized protein BP5553_02502 [Venustampulla echinocandica]|uniref:Uncharacterized protein n=1 Tax=Venustampulla echinocandica TaxID=2656787 RepID=A0A370U453_9HELO|nr:uncharacterized protein BP5553_02502 [Venustampulla echinocandica]RDL42523.1 hypothetical protein BP5553_02502 [Venustampulla echinocandica]
MLVKQVNEDRTDDGNGGYQGVSAAHLSQLYTYLKSQYPEVEVIEEREPYLVIWCTGSVPEPPKLPFRIAGLQGVWLVSGRDSLPPEFTEDDIGSLAEVLELDDDLAEDIREYRLPKPSTLCRMMQEHFPDALGISFVNNRIRIELEELPIEEYRERLTTLPGRFQHTRILIMYYNGLLNTGREKHRGLKQPMPQKDDKQFDGLDYVAAQGYFQPGSMLCNSSGDIVSAGIQGRTHVGHISSRIEDTDIGLATLNDNVELRNRFLHLPGGPSKLLYSDTVRSDDYYMIDSLTTGRQGTLLLCKGKRAIEREQNGTSQVVVQLIFAASDPLAYTPNIRARCCGSALIRLVPKAGRGKKSATNERVTPCKQSTPNTPGLVELANDGEIGGFISCCELQEKTDKPLLICYAETTDSLIDAGWEVVKTAEKRKRTGSEDPSLD